jgi:DNA repair protein RecN (Recombination protein N)
VLVELHIEDLGVIERVQLLLGAGLTAVTGETGAGKTMIVGAIELLAGGRADASMVRTGAAEARVVGRFVPGPDGADELVVTRVVPADGRSRAYVDGRPATVATVAELLAPMVDLHGQHAHQALLSPAAQRAALDRYGSVDVSTWRSARRLVADLVATRTELGGDAAARAREIDLVRHQIGEIDAARIDDVDEDLRLAAEETLLGDADAHRVAGATASAALTDDGAARDAIATARGALGGRTPFEAIATRLDALVAELDDVARELRHLVESIDDDPARLAEVVARRQLLRDLGRKYGPDLVSILDFRHEASERLRHLEDLDRRATSIDAEHAAAVAAERVAAREVGERRRAAAVGFAAEIEQVLHRLAMPGARVVHACDPDDVAAERAQLALAANPGAEPLPLARVASGGELARAMLAIRLVLLGSDTSPMTLVFDEVDAGIGGAAAVAVGEALAALGSSHQVLVVTHLAQVAALADTQVTVAKSIEAGRTTTAVQEVAGDPRIDELARMLAGDVTDAAREHAATLLTGRRRRSTRATPRPR